MRANYINQAAIEILRNYDKYCQKVNETVGRLQNILMN